VTSGYASLTTGERLTLVDEPVGPRNFIAPELEDGRTDEIGTSSDVYSLGKLLYWIVTGGQIFAREKHTHPRLDLRQNTKDATIFFVYELLDKTIVFEPQDRLPNGDVVAAYAEGIIRRILMNANPVNIKAPQLCSYCGVGEYRVVEGSNEYSDFTPKGPSTSIGIPLWGANNYFILGCEHCGNVQFFRPKYAKDPNIWKTN
jgi:serine/threonine protein kinase